MIRINLLPARQSRRQEAIRRELLLLAIGGGAVLFLCATLFILVLARVNEVKSENAQLEKDLENLKTVVARVDEVERINQELKKKLAVIAELQKKRVGPVHLLDELAEATPEKLYLKSLKEKDRKIDLAGYAASNEVISQFLINLEKSDWFDDVYLLGINQETQNGFNLKGFQITARMVVPEEKRQKTGAEGEKTDFGTGVSPAPGTTAPPSDEAAPAAGEAAPKGGAPRAGPAASGAKPTAAGAPPAAPHPTRPEPKAASIGE
jgi:type IV pilus assembly protein PilN